LEKVWLEKLGKGRLAAVKDSRLAASGGGIETAAALERVAFQRVRELQTVLRPYAENRVEKPYFLYGIIDVSIFIKKTKNAKK
jgi:hypothetical protein